MHQSATSGRASFLPEATRRQRGSFPDSKVKATVQDAIYKLSKKEEIAQNDLAIDDVSKGVKDAGSNFGRENARVTPIPKATELTTDMLETGKKKHEEQMQFATQETSSARALPRRRTAP